MLFDNDSVDYKRIAKIAKLSKVEFAKLLGVTSSSVRYNEKIPTAVATRLREIGTIVNSVAQYFEGNVSKVQLWFRLPNPMLGNISPRDMIRLERHHRLQTFVLGAIEIEASAMIEVAAQHSPSMAKQENTIWHVLDDNATSSLSKP